MLELNFGALIKDKNYAWGGIEDGNFLTLDGDTNFHHRHHHNLNEVKLMKFYISF